MVVLRMKIVVVGEATVGKTAFVQMAHSGGVTFPKNYMMTLGCDLCVKEIQIDLNTTVEVFLYDVAGQKAYEHLCAQYLEGATAFLLVYDVSNKTTFETCKKWVDRARRANKSILGFLVANKVDLMDKAEVTDSQGEIFARANNLRFFKSSALRGVGIAEPLEELAKLQVEAYNERCRALASIK
jgi:intraflagellar transport protein 27